MTSTRTRLASLGFAGLGLTAVLAGCATPGDGGTGTGGDTGGGANVDTSAEYADGTYSATGEYVSPAPGTSRIDVEITIADDIVTAVTVTPLATDSTSKGFQTQFADGIAAVVVGQDIDTLNVSRVGGSSLTSGGFNDALAQIKADALT